jgi:hypothetical protein
VFLTLQGVVNPPQNQILIGQRLRATVNFDGLTTTGINRFTWDVSGGSPFINYVPGPFVNNQPATLTVYEPWQQVVHERDSVEDPYPTSDSVSTCFSGADKGATISCHVVIQSPALDFTVVKSVALDHPNLKSDQAQIVGDMTLLPTNINPNSYKLQLPAPATTGAQYFYWAETPSGYYETYNQGTGRFCAVQLVTDTGTLTLIDNSIVNLAAYQEKCLDGAYPYQSVSTDWAPAVSAPESPSLWRHLDDDPFNGVNALVKELNFHSDFEIYILYDAPNNGVGRLDVPLWKKVWHARGIATSHSPQPWTSTDDSGSDGVQLYPVHPRWRYIWAPGP